MFGDPAGALVSVNGPQSGFESRTSSLMTPLNGFFAMTTLPRLQSSTCHLFSNAWSNTGNCLIGRFPETGETNPKSSSSAQDALEACARHRGETNARQPRSHRDDLTFGV